MGATNSTLHYQLSQFISTDKPAWLQDYNGDMQKIDNGINAALVAAESAQNSADSANTGVGAVSDAVTALQTTVAGHTSDITDLSGDVNTIESLIGNGTPTAGDHTLIGAINANTNEIANIESDTGWLDLRTSYIAKYRRVGKVVTIIIDTQTAAVPSGSPVTVGTLPENCRPVVRIIVPAVGGAASSTLAILTVRPNGDVDISQNSGSNLSYINTAISFIVA